MIRLEDLQKYKEENKKEREEFQKHLDELKRKEWEEKGITPMTTEKIPEKRCDHPNTIEDSTATFVWIVVMVLGSIFNDRWLIWIVATVVWAKFITRYKN